MPSARFEPPLPGIERPQTDTSVRTATGISPLQVIVVVVVVVVVVHKVFTKLFHVQTVSPSNSPPKIFKFPSVSQGKCSDSRTVTATLLALHAKLLPGHQRQSPSCTLNCVAEKVRLKIPEINLSIDQKKPFRIRRDKDDKRN